MKRGMVKVVCAAAVLAALAAPAARAEHYVNGVEGIKAGSVPPPGFYWRMYNVFYRATTVRDTDGEKAPVDPTINVYGFVNRGIWVSDLEVLGGNYFADLVVPLVYTSVKMDALDVNDSMFGLGDICVEPAGVSWHGPQYDAAVALGLYLPVGRYDQDDMASAGQDMWTGMATAGGTLYADAERTWSASVLARYEVHSFQRDLDIRSG